MVSFKKDDKMVTGIVLLIISLILIKPVLGARNLDDDPVATGDSDEDKYVRWASGELKRWPGAPLPITLKYGFEQKMKTMDIESVTMDYLSQKEIDNVFARAFTKWSSAIQVSFEEVEYSSSSKPDIRIGFFYFDRWMKEHLIYTSLPPTGTLRLNADIRWALDFNSLMDQDAFDLESVAIHAIGHVLGLDHSHSEGAIMYQKMSPGIKKRDLSFEDVSMAQKLYGPNPEYHLHHMEYEYHPHPETIPEHHYHHSHSSSPAPSQQLSSSTTSLKDQLTVRSLLGFNIFLLFAASFLLLAS